MKKILFLLLIFWLINSNLAESKNYSVRIIAAGDIMAHLGQVKSATNKDGKTFDFHSNYRFVKQYIDSADIAVCNFETTLGGPPFKGFPAFSSPDTLAYAVKYAGFDIAFTANNHCLDRGSKGLMRTIEILNKAGLQTSGTFLDSIDKSKRNIIYYSKNNIKIAFLNYTYGTNGIAVKPPQIVNYINRDEIIANIKIAKNNKADIVVLFVHWGSEYSRFPNKSQEELATLFANNGLDVIIGHHPHVVQPIKTIWNEFEANKKRKVLISYSLGNFISNQNWRYSDGGIFFDFVVNKSESGQVWISDEKYEPVYVYRDHSSGKKKYYLIMPNYIDSYREIFKFSKPDSFKIMQFLDDTNQLIGNFK